VIWKASWPSGLTAATCPAGVELRTAEVGERSGQANPRSVCIPRMGTRYLLMSDAQED
jgi:hypothetical protein